MQTIILDISNIANLSVEPKHLDGRVFVQSKQGDVGRKFKAVIVDGECDFQIPVGAQFSLWYSGPGGEGNYSAIGDRSAFMVTGNSVTVELITQMLSKPGFGVMCLVLHGADGTQIGFWNLNYSVEAVPGMESDEARTYYTALSELAMQAIGAAQTFETDSTLSMSGKAADAAAVGAEISNTAPAGYGLGTIPADITDVRTLDDTVLSGWYRWMGGDENKLGDSFSYCAIRVDSLDSTAVCQTAIETSARASMVRWKGYGSGYLGWSAWEWVNPPMALGVEYRTTERWQGKPAYTKLVDCGAIASGKVVNLLSDSVTVHRYSGILGDNIPLPLLGANLDASGYCELSIYKSTNGVQATILCGTNASGQNMKLQLWYTKPIDIDSQPKSVAAPLGDTVTFHVDAVGEGLTYQWQWRSKTTYDWSATSVTGNKTDTINVEVTEARNGYQYRCVITDAHGNSVASNMATLMLKG